MTQLRLIGFGKQTGKPTMAFKGVRISWLILARNADLSLSDSSAFSLA